MYSFKHTNLPRIDVSPLHNKSKSGNNSSGLKVARKHVKGDTTPHPLLMKLKLKNQESEAVPLIQGKLTFMYKYMEMITHSILYLYFEVLHWKEHKRNQYFKTINNKLYNSKFIMLHT